MGNPQSPSSECTSTSTMEICFLLWICLLNVVTSYHFEHFEERRPSKYEQSHDRRRNFNFNPFRKRTHGTYYDQRRQRPRFPRQQSPDSYGAPSEPPVTNAPQTCPAECSCSCPSTPPPSPAPTRPPPSSYYSSSPPPPSSTTTQAPPPQPSYSNYVTQAPIPTLEDHPSTHNQMKLRLQHNPT